MRSSFVKETAHLFLEGSPETLAGFIITLDACVRNTVHLLQPGGGTPMRYVQPCEAPPNRDPQGYTLRWDGRDLVVMDSQGNTFNV